MEVCKVKGFHSRHGEGWSRSRGQSGDIRTGSTWGTNTSITSWSMTFDFDVRGNRLYLAGASSSRSSHGSLGDSNGIGNSASNCSGDDARSEKHTPLMHIGTQNRYHSWY